MRFIPLALALSLGFAVPAAARFVTVDDVRNMAFAKGIVKIEEVELHNGIWKVEGEDAGGHEIKMKVDAWSGQIIKLKLDD
jgi:peptidase YpeB-like protein